MRILILTDGSDFSRAAIEKCCRFIIAPGKTAVKIVSVYEVVEPMDISISPEFSQELEAAARTQAEEYAEQSAAQIKERFPDSNLDLSVQVSIGAPDKILIETAKEWAADLIVIGSHGRGFWSRMLLGSVTDALVHNAPCSVLVVRKTNRETV